MNVLQVQVVDGVIMNVGLGTMLALRISRHQRAVALQLTMVRIGIDLVLRLALPCFMLRPPLAMLAEKLPMVVGAQLLISVTLDLQTDAQPSMSVIHVHCLVSVFLENRKLGRMHLVIVPPLLRQALLLHA